MKKKRWLAILLSFSLFLTLVPAQAFAEEGTEGTEITCTQTADCPAQVHEPDCPLWQEDSTEPEGSVLDEPVPGETGPDETGPDEPVPGETGPDETGPDETIPGETSPEEPEEPGEPEEIQPTAAEVLALIAALPDPGAVTAENAEAAETQLRELLALYQALDADGQEEVGDAILRAIELKAILDALSGEDSGQAMLAETVTGVTYQDVEYDADGNVQFDSAGQVKYTTKTTDEGVAVSREGIEYGILTLETGWYVVNSDVTLGEVETIFVQGDVHLILVDGYTLNANSGICVPSGNSLTIYGQSAGTGTVNATTSFTNAGIGGASAFPTSGTITINGGTVYAAGCYSSAGIGDSVGGAGTGSITINGGTVTANGDRDSSAGIGGGRDSRGGNITINGGTVTANGGIDGAGIGGGYPPTNGFSTITIRGGTVYATGNGNGSGIGNQGAASFSTTAADGTPGNAFIVASSISDTSDQANWSGVIITGDSGQVYGSPTLTTDATVPSGATLTVPKDSTLTIYKDVTLTNDGIITNNGAIWNGGTIINNGTITGNEVQNGVFVDYQAYANGEFTEQNHFAIPVTDQTTWGTSGQETWYVVNSETPLTIDSRITVSGDVHLILADGCTLTAEQGINVPEGNSLTIYGQTAGTGTLKATGGDEQAGIGGDFGSSSGTITIHGGVVEATGGNCRENADFSNGGAGIGGGSGMDNGGIGAVTIYGGTVTAKGGSGKLGSGAGIGGGGSTGSGGGGTVTICGGTVTATGGSGNFGGAGIGGGGGGFSGGDSTVTISGGFVAATGGNGNFGGAAIGTGGTARATGSETDTNKFNNCVVLRQSGAVDSTMTGTVYGEDVTLTTDATVPENAALTIDENMTLTIVKGVTLTNKGAIYVDATLNYGSEGYGTLTNEDDGAVYYPLTVTGGTVAGTGSADIVTVNEKQYAKQGAILTVTAPPETPVGQTAVFTIKVNDGDAQTGNSFTMPGKATQVEIIRFSYENAPSYTVTIPASVSIGDTATATVKAESVNVAEGYNLNVKLTGTGTDGTGTDFTLALQDDATETLAYTVTKGTSEEKTEVKVTDTVLTVAGGTANSSGTATLSFALADTAVVKYSGTYTGTVTFTVSVEQADSTGGTD